MMNLLIRILSFTICIGLLVGGAMLSYKKTKDNKELTADLDDVKQTPWVAAIETDAGNE